MKQSFFCFFIATCQSVLVLGQSERIELADPDYLEDQFYMGFAYNFLINKPENVAQHSLSYNLQFGMVKDIPLNQNRNIGLGIGLGYAANSYYNNIGVEKLGEDTFAYSLIGSFKRNKIETHEIEMPIQLRLRTSNSTDHRFWRVYTGIKLGYAFTGNSTLVTEDSRTTFKNSDIQKFNYGLTMDFGYNTFNIHFYYGINTLIANDASLNGEGIDISVLKVGMMFYIL